MPEAIPLYRKYLPKLRLETVALPSRSTIMAMTGAIAEKDVPVLASAVACGAQYLIPGDKKAHFGSSLIFEDLRFKGMLQGKANVAQFRE